MLSVLIPIFNHDVTRLVGELTMQCSKAKIPFQILCFDDGSKEKYLVANRALDGVYGVSYIELGTNIGRSAIRNKLAYNAMYDYLLFLDCDSEIRSKKFIKRYVNEMKQKVPIVYGGRQYSKRPPRSKKKRLHWTYGVKKEARPAKRRAKLGNLAFQSNNYLITRDLALEFPFDENIRGYGHEDTMLALRLQSAHHFIKHIDNPILHRGVEETKNFLEKTKEGLRNLVLLRQEYPIMQTPVTSAYDTLRGMWMHKVFRWIYNRWEDRIMENLYGTNPSMRLFDFYKLYHYSRYVENGTPDKKG